MKISLKTHPLGTVTANGCQISPQTMARIRTHVLIDPKAPQNASGSTVPLYPPFLTSSPHCLPLQVHSQCWGEWRGWRSSKPNLPTIVTTGLILSSISSLALLRQMVAGRYGKCMDSRTGCVFDSICCLSCVVYLLWVYKCVELVYVCVCVCVYYFFFSYLAISQPQFFAL